MPYEIKKSGEGFKVFKKGTSKAFSKSPMKKKEADAQLKALYANTNEGKTNTMKKSELTKMIQEIIKEVLSEQAEETNESVYHSKKVKIVLSGGDVEEKHDRIISTLKKIDPETTIKYFDATKKIVGTFSNKLVKAINTNLRSLNINDVKVEVK